ncbi:hypothetical protein D1114_21225 [Cereibacter sphaeroides]|uniref:Uncharacterized protein n=1 Tax=Cereibacter sphaeroides TaxID=1063 RepID=A0AAX1UFK8_CERSP|nr:hypothetical protein D1114_21225 [Cereibacter sphaeroides]
MFCTPRVEQWGAGIGRDRPLTPLRGWRHNILAHCQSVKNFSVATTPIRSHSDLGAGPVPRLRLHSENVRDERRFAAGGTRPRGQRGGPATTQGREDPPDGERLSRQPVGPKQVGEVLAEKIMALSGFREAGPSMRLGGGASAVPARQRRSAPCQWEVSQPCPSLTLS